MPGLEGDAGAATSKLQHTYIEKAMYLFWILQHYGLILTPLLREIHF